MQKLQTKCFFSLFLFTFLCCTLQAQPERKSLTSFNLLSEAYPVSDLMQILTSREAFHPYPTYQDRSVWEGLPDSIKNIYISQAEKNLDFAWPPLPATLFLEYAINGNRSNYQDERSKRRDALLNFILAECMEGKGRFLNQIANGIWAICEESFWGVPAHMGLQEAGVGLPDVEEPVVDLFAAETGALLSWSDYLLNESLDQISPLLRKRIFYETNRRILTPAQNRDDFWWMGFNSDRPVNNWNPWINSNWLTADLLLEKDPKRRVYMVHKIMRSLDNYLNPYPADGGCDEGPGYWSRAAGSLFDCLNLLQKASQDTISVFDNTLIQNMGKYIYRVHIDDHYFVNYADASAKEDVEGFLIYNYGKQIQDKDMMAFGAVNAQKKWKEEHQLVDDRSMGRHLRAIFSYQDVMQQKGYDPYLRDVWLPDVQVMTARAQAGSPQGLFVSAKGGNNAESHNHNDVGNFIVYMDGQPAVMDIGVEEYTAKTFSSHRYDIWTMQSAYHNLPTINGVMQMNGPQYAAKNVQYSQDKEGMTFSLDIAKAYPEKAQVKTWQRTIRFSRNKEVAIQDQYELTALQGPLTQSFMSAFSAEKIGAGKIQLTSQSKTHPATAFIQYDAGMFDVAIEKIPITDRRLQYSWENPLTRMVFTARNPQLQGHWKFTVSASEEPSNALIK